MVVVGKEVRLEVGVGGVCLSRYITVSVLSIVLLRRIWPVGMGGCGDEICSVQFELVYLPVFLPEWRKSTERLGRQEKGDR
jgi:hypothetical protein